MKQNKKIMLAVQIAAAAGTVLVLAGCNADKSSVTDFFPADEARSTQNLMTAQAAAGARNDATLQPMHFDGTKLNSLGESKLDLMLKDDDSVESINVYLNTDANDVRYNARSEAITSYFEDRGIDKAALHIEAGPNPHVSVMAAELIEREPRTESAGGGDDSKSSSPAGGAGAAPAGK